MADLRDTWNRLGYMPAASKAQRILRSSDPAAAYERETQGLNADQIRALQISLYCYHPEGNNGSTSNYRNLTMAEFEAFAASNESFRTIVGAAAPEAPEGPAAPTEVDVNTALAAAEASVPAIVGWINTNRDAINAQIQALPISDEQKQTLLIGAALPADATLQSAAFLKAYAAVETIGQSELVQNNLGLFAQTNAIGGVIDSYTLIKTVLGDDAEIPADPMEAVAAAGALNLRKIVSDLDQAQTLGNLPDFDFAANPYDVTSTDFINAYATAFVQADRLAAPILESIAASDTVADAVKAQIAAAPNTLAKYQVVLQAGILPEAQQNVVYAAYSLASAGLLLSDDQRAAIDPLAREAITRIRGNNPTAPGGEAPQMTPAEIMALFSPEIRYATYAVERAFDNRSDYDASERDWDPDQFLDHRTRHEINDLVTNAFDSFGEDFHGDNISRIIVEKGADGQNKYYAFNEEGYIFEVEVTGDFVEDHSYVNDDPDFPYVTAVLEEGATATYKDSPAVGHISQGIHVRDENGQINSVHPAAAAFMGWVFEKSDEALRERDTSIESFFESIPESVAPALEDELRLALSDSSLTEDQFRNSEIFRKLKEARGNDADLDVFVTGLFALNLNGFANGADTLGLVQGAGESSAVYNLLRYLSGSDVNRGHQALRDQTPHVRDNILSRNGYEILKQMHNGQSVALAVLEDTREGSEHQVAALHKYFADAEGVIPQTVTREQVYEFVRHQFDLRAITTLGDLKLENADLASMSEADQERFREHLGSDLTEEMVAAMSTEAQRQLITNNMDVLDLVSRAMADGEFNPDDRDVRLVFKAFERPDLSNPSIRALIDEHRQSGQVPSGAYGMRYFTNDELAEVTGIPNINDPAAYTTAERREILDEVFRNPPADLWNNATYQRMVQNFYEPFLANYTWFRNGEVDDNTPDTWNGRYGEPGPDELLHMFMQYNKSRLDDMFPNGAHRTLFRGGENRVNFNLTYDEARQRLAEIDAAEGTNHVATLDAGIEALNRPSMYMYMMDLRLSHYRDLRNNHYLPGLKDRRIAPEFNAANNDTPDGPDGPGTGDPDARPEAEPTNEVEAEPDWENLGAVASAVAMPPRMRRITVPGTEIVVRPGTDIINYEGRGSATVIPAHINTEKARRDIIRGYGALKLAERGATEGERDVGRRGANAVKSRYNLTDEELARYGAQFEAERAANIKARNAGTSDPETRARTTPVDPESATVRDAPGAGTGADAEGRVTTGKEIIPLSDGREIITTDPGSTALVEGQNRSVAVIEPGTALTVVDDIDETARLGLHMIDGRYISGGAAAFSTYYAFAESDQAWERNARLGAAAIDIGLAVDDIAYNSAHFGGTASKVLRSGGVAVVVSTGVEVGIHMANKDGQAAGGAATVGAFALGGMGIGAGIGSVVPVAGTAVGGVVGTVVGTLAGVTAVAYTGVENWAGRRFNNIVYNGSWFNDGMVAETRDILAQVEEYKARLAEGNLSQAELAEYKELLEDMEDHLIDLQSAEVTLAQLALPSWHAVDANGDGIMTEEEMNAGNSADHQNIQFWVTNRQLQEQLSAAREELATAYDTERHSQLDALLDGATSADDVERRLRGEFAHVANNIDNTWQVQGWWNNQDDWRADINEIREKISFGEGENAVLQISHLSHEEIRDLQRDLTNTREEVEDRIQNLLYEASRGKLSNAEFDELRLLRDDLRSIDELEATLWENAGPLNDRAVQKQQTFDWERTRDAVRGAIGSDGRINRDALQSFLNQAENADLVHGREDIGWMWLTTAGISKLERRVDKYDLTETELDNLSEEDLTDKFESLIDVEEDLHNRIYNLMLQASEGTLSRDDAANLEKAISAYEQLLEAKAEYEAQFAENRGDITGQPDLAPTRDARGPTMTVATPLS